jgi:hypothetical protein
MSPTQKRVSAYALEAVRISYRESDGRKTPRSSVFSLQEEGQLRANGNCAPSQTDYVAVTEIVLCNVLGLIPPSPRLLTIGQLM